MLKRILQWLLTKVDVSVELKEDLLTIKIMYMSMTVWTHTFDLIKGIGGHVMEQEHMKGPGHVGGSLL